MMGSRSWWFVWSDGSCRPSMSRPQDCETQPHIDLDLRDILHVGYSRLLNYQFLLADLAVTGICGLSQAGACHFLALRTAFLYQPLYFDQL